MTRRKLLLVTAGTTVLGLAALVGFANHNAIFANDDDDEGQEALIKVLGEAKINLQQGLAAGAQEGQPISAKFKVDDGKFQLSVYTVKDGKFSELLVDYADGKVTKSEPITKGDDLAAANSQWAAMVTATTSLERRSRQGSGRVSEPACGQCGAKSQRRRASGGLHRAARWRAVQTRRTAPGLEMMAPC